MNLYRSLENCKAARWQKTIDADSHESTLIQKFLAFLQSIHISVWEYPFSSQPSLPNAPQIHILGSIVKKKEKIHGILRVDEMNSIGICALKDLWLNLTIDNATIPKRSGRGTRSRSGSSKKRSKALNHIREYHQAMRLGGQSWEPIPHRLAATKFLTSSHTGRSSKSHSGKPGLET